MHITVITVCSLLLGLMPLVEQHIASYRICKQLNHIHITNIQIINVSMINVIHIIHWIIIIIIIIIMIMMIMQLVSGGLYRCLWTNTPFLRAFALQSSGRKLQSSPWFGAPKADIPMYIIFRRSVIFTDTGTLLFNVEAICCRLPLKVCNALQALQLFIST